MTIDLTEGVKINDSMVSTPDIDAANGVIHVIDKMLIPNDFVLSGNNIVDVALGNEDFSMLVALLQKADLVSALQGEGPFTVFAPTDAAFEKLLAALDISASDLMQQPDLAKVLLYHVVQGKAMSGDLQDGMQLTTLNGESLTVDLTDGVQINSSTVVLADIQAINGVVHVIDEILVPTNFTLQNVIEDTEIPYTGVASQLPALLIGGVSVACLLYFLLHSKTKKSF